MQHYLLAFTLIAAVFAFDTPVGTPLEHLETNSLNASVTGTAVCRDPQLATFMNIAMSRYIHDMDGLSKNILNQITAARKAGTWLVHAQIIAGGRQGPDWQTTTNAAIFTGKDLYGCFYHDTMTYILVLRVY